jgi:hypothetical protein
MIGPANLAALAQVSIVARAFLQELADSSGGRGDASLARRTVSRRLALLVTAGEDAN